MYGIAVSDGSRSIVVHLNVRICLVSTGTGGLQPGVRYTCKSSTVRKKSRLGALSGGHRRRGDCRARCRDRGSVVACRTRAGWWTLGRDGGLGGALDAGTLASHRAVSNRDSALSRSACSTALGNNGGGWRGLSSGGMRCLSTDGARTFIVIGVGRGDHRARGARRWSACRGPG